MGQPLRVLLVEDSADDVELTLRELTRGGYDPTPRQVQTSAEMAEALAAGTWDVILCDFRLPRFSAPEALALSARLGTETPVIILSGTVGEEEAVESLRAGARDFIGKGRLTRLCPAVARELRESEQRLARRRVESQLQQAQKIEAVGQLAGGVAHDFNNLLGVILGYGDVLLTELPRDDSRRSRVEGIQAAAQRGAALTRQLLAFSRRQVLQPTVLQLNSVLRELEEMVRRLIGEQIESEFVLAPDLAAVRADRSQLEQVVINLVVNARDAMPGGGRLVLSTTNREVDAAFAGRYTGLTPGSYVLLSVRDSGHGMDAETLARAFEPFFTTKELGKGTGLGLSMVYGIVKQSAGYIDLVSSPGQGTEVKIYLPQVAGLVEVEAPRPAATDTPQGGAETILLLEDEEALRVILHECLEDSGYRVVTAGTPQEALETALGGSERIDLLLSDVVMPRMNGPETVARVRERFPAVKVLLMSGYAFENVGPRQAELLGEFAFLQKPFAPGVLRRKLRELLDG